MPKPRITSVDDYITAQPDAARSMLERLRKTIRKAIPDAEEVMAYGMPTYKLKGVSALHFAAWKGYCSLYPANDRVLAAFGDELAALEVVRSTIHFFFAKPLPVGLIDRIARFRAREVNAKTLARSRPLR